MERKSMEGGLAAGKRGRGNTLEKKRRAGKGFP